MIEAVGLTKRYGDKVAVDDLSFAVQPGTVTGFLGPNGAGKSTTFRCILGLDRPTAGRVTVNGRSYRDIPAPLHEVGALLEARSVHPGRSARNHLRMLAATHGISSRRVDQVLGMVGIEDVADHRVGGFSLGMGQRLGVAVALLGDPQVLLLDEPVNGLDPEGIRWIRQLLRDLASQGRTIFVSSHLMSEMAQTAEHVMVIGRGKLIADASIEQIVSGASGARVRVRTPRRKELVAALTAQGLTATPVDVDGLDVAGAAAAAIGDLAFEHGIVLHELTTQEATLEEAYMQLTADDVEFAAHPAEGAA
ncbi:MAG: type transport system ATP-binding protein [Pseudonocardiales bacterium]|nr:type transport system ATP-binding protein [Pseudonocardiales bacterium]